MHYNDAICSFPLLFSAESVADHEAYFTNTPALLPIALDCRGFQTGGSSKSTSFGACGKEDRKRRKFSRICKLASWPTLPPKKKTQAPWPWHDGCAPGVAQVCNDFPPTPSLECSTILGRKTCRHGRHGRHGSSRTRWTTGGRSC